MQFQFDAKLFSITQRWVNWAGGMGARMLTSVWLNEWVPSLWEIPLRCIWSWQLFGGKLELEEGGKKKKMKSEIRRLGIERRERRKEKWMKSRTKRRSAQAFGGISGSSFARICSMSTAHYFMIMSKLSSLTSIWSDGEERQEGEKGREDEMRIKQKRRRS